MKLGIPSALAFVLGAVGCSAPPRPAPIFVDQRAWTSSREELEGWRRATDVDEAYVELVRVAVHEPHTGRVFEGRGAVAVDPHRALRLILLGPGGSTALDAWVTRDAWRFEVPAMHFKRRGTTGQESAELPIAFLRWWFLTSLDGRLLTVQPELGGRTYVLREGASTVLLRAVGGPGARHHFVAVRREGEALERLEWIAPRVRPGPGDRARYRQKSTGLVVDVLVDAISTRPPDPAAFVDPDEAGLSL